jgi:hypothetical protein
MNHKIELRSLFMGLVLGGAVVLSLAPVLP